MTPSKKAERRAAPSLSPKVWESRLKRRLTDRTVRVEQLASKPLAERLEWIDGAPPLPRPLEPVGMQN